MRRFLPIAIVVLCATQVWARTLYVPGDYNSIQSAIDDANDSDVVIASPGMYQENINFLGKAITVQSINPDDPNIVAATIIDGNAPADSNFGSAVTFNNAEDNNSVLCGFTITGGTGSWLVVSWEGKGPRWNRCGGGVVCYNMSEPTISKNVFTNNTAGQGGGIYIYGDPVNPDDPSDPTIHLVPVITDNSFLNNYAIIEHGFAPPDTNYPNNDHGDGGAIVAFQGCDGIITGNLIENNHADAYGGGIHWRQWSNGLIENNQIINNTARLGGGIHITYTSSPTVRKNLVQGNTAGGLGGGGIYVYNVSTPLIEHNWIKGNSSTNGSGIAVKYSSSPEIRNNVINNNLEGSAIACTGSSSWIHHNTIINNSCSIINRQGGIECIVFNYPTIENNIIANTSLGYGIYIDEGGWPTIRYNNFWRNDLGIYGPYTQDINEIEGNICTYPDVIDEYGHLSLISGCIDAGDPNFVSEVNEVDIDGNPRVLNTRTDIGADEVMPVWNLSSGQQYETIQPAIDDANNGEEIVVIAKRYYENINIDGKSISLHSAKPANWEYIGNTIIDGNQADDAVVTFAGTEDSNCVVAGFTITDANNSGQGGGIAGNGTNATLSFCQITDNAANQGGGIYDFDGLIENCKISNNTSETSGGGLYGCDEKIYNCFIADNHAGTNGGGLYDCNASIINNTIAKNSASITAGGLQLCHDTISNCIVWANTAPNNPGLDDCCQPTFSCLQSTIAGEGNIYTDPQFVDSNNGDYHLTIYSDCIDAGDNNSVPAESVFDINKESRLFAFDPNKTPRVDIGADEVITNRADFDDDGAVNYRDVAIMKEQWLISGTGLRCDLMPDGFVDFSDYTFLADNWPWQTGWYRTARESALQFDSNSDGYVWIHTPEGCNLNNVFTFTYTAWVYPLDVSEIHSRIIGKNERAFMTSGSTLVGYSHHVGPAQSVSDVGLLHKGKWQFVVMTFNHTGDKKVHLYIDGKEVTYQYQNAGTGDTLPDWRTEGEWDLMIGSQAWSPGTYIPNAIIDEVAIYDRVLTQDEIDYLHNYGLGRPTPSSLNPIGLWHLDEKQGTAVLDNSGNGNNGQLMGTTPPVWTDGRFLEY